MTRHSGGDYVYSRRAFLAKMRWAPLLFLPAPLYGLPRPSATGSSAAFPFSDFHLTPHYPGKSPLEDILRRVAAGSDDYPMEQYALEVLTLLNAWGQELKTVPPGLGALGKFLHPAMESNSLTGAQEADLRKGSGIEIVRKKFLRTMLSGRESFLHEMKNSLASMSRVETTEFEIVSIRESPSRSETIPQAKSQSAKVQMDIRYDIVGLRTGNGREERVGNWQTEWTRGESGWRVLRWTATEETVSRARGPVFADITLQTLGATPSYQNQLIHGVDYWRTTLDGACGIDVYGNNGVAVGDFLGDGLDGLYVCQPAGLPNRLYRNRGDGTMEDVTERAGVDVLDSTACALFADFENKGLQDLLVVCGSGPLLFLNQGNGKFQRKRDAFKFAAPPQGTFTHAALADYDGDGRLDIYFCLYSYYLGLDQYHYPTPYYDARNGPPNFLLRNEGNATFRDQTEAAGLNAENDRYSFACAWGDSNGDGHPDLYVINDFGRSNLYRNNGDGTFKAVSSEAGVVDVGAGMSASWFDFDGDGKQDLYAANMWSAAGLRVSEQPQFHEKDPEEIRALYRRHARGNSLYKNLGDGKFQNVGDSAGVEIGRWAWSSDSWDFDHDGYPDLYIANGYISGPKTPEAAHDDLGSFFWRELVAKSPVDGSASVSYEQGWSAINELIRSDSSWNGRERNILYVNNQDGTFSEASGVSGMDFPDDSRAFALADLDHDGHLEVFLKNRSGPQIRVLRNVMAELGNSISLRLRGVKSNRDAIGAAVTLTSAGHRQTKYVQAGTGFLSQHTKELFFGVGKVEGTVRASVRWPSGSEQFFERLPVNHRVDIVEGSDEFEAKLYAASRFADERSAEILKSEGLPDAVETWLIEPIRAPEFSLPDFTGKLRELRALSGGPLLLNFWTAASPVCRELLQQMDHNLSRLTASGLRIVGISIDEASGSAAENASGTPSRLLASKLAFPNLFGTQEVLGVYNIVYRYLFDRRRDLALPTWFLIDADSMIVKVYRGPVDPERLLEDAKSLPRTPQERIQRALPFRGTLHQDSLQRNAFTYGVAFFQHGYLDQAEASFRQVIAVKPENPEAYYNLGTLYLRRNALPEARQYLERTVKLRPQYPEAWNNLGMIAAQEGHVDEAVANLRRSLEQRPNYVTALLNLGNVYRRQKVLDEAEHLLVRAVKLEPENPEANYGLAMFYVQQEQWERALEYLQKAVDLRPAYPEALNNLGVMFVRTKNYPAAEERFKTCIRVAPTFDQAYLNLARVYVVLDNKDKAREVLHTLLQQQPQHKLAQQTLEMLD